MRGHAHGTGLHAPFVATATSLKADVLRLRDELNREAFQRQQPVPRQLAHERELKDRNSLLQRQLEEQVQHRSALLPTRLALKKPTSHGYRLGGKLRICRRSTVSWRLCELKMSASKPQAPWRTSDWCVTPPPRARLIFIRQTLTRLSAGSKGEGGRHAHCLVPRPAACH